MAQFWGPVSTNCPGMKLPSFLWVLVTSGHGHYQSRETDEAGGHARDGWGEALASCYVRS